MEEIDGFRRAKQRVSRVVVRRNLIADRSPRTCFPVEKRESQAFGYVIPADRERSTYVRS